jgi:hypothetical protein
MVDYFIGKINDEKDFDISSVRKEMEQNNVPEDEIKIVVRLVDNELQRRITTKTTNTQSNELIWIGAAVTLVGAGITLGSYFGILDTGNSLIIAYGPFLSGIGILLAGLARKR